MDLSGSALRTIMSTITLTRHCQRQVSAPKGAAFHGGNGSGTQQIKDTLQSISRLTDEPNRDHKDANVAIVYWWTIRCPDFCSALPRWCFQFRTTCLFCELLVPVRAVVFFFKDPSIRNEMAHTHTRQDQSCVTPDSLGNEPSRLETKAGPSSLFLPLSFSALLAFWCQGCWTTSAESKQYTHQEQIFSFLIFVYFFVLCTPSDSEGCVCDRERKARKQPAITRTFLMISDCDNEKWF